VAASWGWVWLRVGVGCGCELGLMRSKEQAFERVAGIPEFGIPPITFFLSFALRRGSLFKFLEYRFPVSGALRLHVVVEIACSRHPS
jgi:hypothetical protein